MLKMAVFWVVAPCSLVDVCRRFRGAFRLNHQGVEALFMEAAIKRNNPEDNPSSYSPP
jgi:hypothetical protein